MFRAARTTGSPPAGSGSSGGNVRIRGCPAGAGAHSTRLGHRHIGAADLAAAAVVELATAAAVGDDHRTLAPDGVAVAPLEQRHQHGPQVEPLLSQAVLVADGMLVIGPP